MIKNLRFHPLVHSRAAASIGRVGQRPPSLFEILETCPSIISAPLIPFLFAPIFSQQLTPKRTFADQCLCIIGCKTVARVKGELP